MTPVPDPSPHSTDPSAASSGVASSGMASSGVASSGMADGGPAIAPLRRLVVRDGLLLDAERWHIAHDYHRQRQNVHYQALHLPGIVSGLEVTVIVPPDHVTARYRDRRWLRVSSGIAIDARGNPIVLDRPVEFRLASVAINQPVVVYLVVRYVDPESLQRSQPTEIVAETFRIDEKTQPPDPWDVELCRVRITPGEMRLQPAADVFAPSDGELDVRHRSQARLRPQAIVRAAFVTTGLPQEDEPTHHHLSTLLAATEGLYAPLHGDPGVIPIDLADPSPEVGTALDQCDLLYLSHRRCLQLPTTAMQWLGQHLRRGGVVVVELPSKDNNLAELDAIAQELERAIADLQDSQQLADLRSQLADELNNLISNRTSRLETVCQSLTVHLQQGQVGCYPLTAPSPTHPLRRTPFTFSQWPTLRSQPPRVLLCGGVVLVIGDLLAAWGGDPALALTRERVRSAQEWGVNLLHFAWQRHHWHLAQGQGQGQSGDRSPASTVPPTNRPANPPAKSPTNLLTNLSPSQTSNQPPDPSSDQPPDPSSDPPSDWAAAIFPPVQPPESPPESPQNSPQNSPSESPQNLSPNLSPNSPPISPNSPPNSPLQNLPPESPPNSPSPNPPPESSP